jgi:hypothetical protein
MSATNEKRLDRRINTLIVDNTLSFTNLYIVPQSPAMTIIPVP